MFKEKLKVAAVSPKISVGNVKNNCDEIINILKSIDSNNIDVVVHIINGLPYETKEMMIEQLGKELDDFKIILKAHKPQAFSWGQFSNTTFVCDIIVNSCSVHFVHRV
mgnify:CR=1 FL=1